MTSDEMGKIMGEYRPDPAPSWRSSSRIEKHRRTEKARPLPTWYYRVAAINVTKDRDPYPEDFYEDLSELEEERSEADTCDLCDGAGADAVANAPKRKTAMQSHSGPTVAPMPTIITN